MQLNRMEWMEPSNRSTLTTETNPKTTNQPPSQPRAPLFYETPPLICDLREIYATSCFPYSDVWKHPTMLTFEKTPSYILIDGAAQLIHTMAPWAKIIVSLRNPIDRYVSKLCVLQMGRNSIAHTIS